MHIIFCTARPTPPSFIGGAEITNMELGIALANKGHLVSFLGSFEPPSPHWRSLQRNYRRIVLSDPRVVVKNDYDGNFSYTFGEIECLSVPQDSLLDHLNNWLIRSPEAVVVTLMERGDQIINHAKLHGNTTVGWFVSISEAGLISANATPDIALCVSSFVQRNLFEKFGLDGKIFYPPFFDTQVHTNRAGSHVTMINPVASKGGELLLEIAHKMPNIKFLAIEGWYSDPEFQRRMPKNVSYLESRYPLDQVWPQCKLLLVPSVAPEGFGRVCVEAGLARVPVIASDIGGIPEALNGAGHLVPDYSSDAWVEAVRHVVQPTVHEALSVQARTAALKFVIDSASRFEYLLERHGDK